VAAPPPIGEDEEIVAGRRPVEEAFVARRKAHRLLVTPQRRQALEKIVLHATSLRIPILEVEGGTLTSVAGFDGHQGVALVVEARHYATPDEILARARERGEPPFVLVLDSLEDPQNVGTLLRSAEAAGVHGVLFPTRRQAPLSPAAVKASAGAVEHLLLAPVDDLAGALADLHIRGLRIVGAEAEAPLTARQADLRGPLAMVVGSEGQGLGTAVRRRTDLLVRIPMRGAIGSLNASVAGSILLFEAVAQRDPDGTATAPRAPSRVATPKAGKGLTAEANLDAGARAPVIAEPATPSTAPKGTTATAAKPAKAAKATTAKAATPAKATKAAKASTVKAPTAKAATRAKAAKAATTAKAAKATAAKAATAARAAKAATSAKPATLKTAAKAPKLANAARATTTANARLATPQTAKPANAAKATPAKEPKATTIAKAPTTATPKKATTAKPAKTATTAKIAKATRASDADATDDELLPGGPPKP
jgi:23S rRNA (guanosine2251-2'-O)-methyltransferase